MQATVQTDVAGKRKLAKYSRGEMATRIGWVLGAQLFRLSPRPLWGFRNALLRLFGARVGRAVRVHPSVEIIIPWTLTLDDEVTVGHRAILYGLGPIRIGARATISQNAHLCAGTHDFADPKFKLLKPPVSIGEDAWICADAFVGPNVTVGAGAVVGARAVAVKDVSPWMIAAGNPAKPLRSRELRAPDANLSDP
ncbi:MAG: hypothetical protein ACFB21_03025 [Opitutales bacterium]